MELSVALGLDRGREDTLKSDTVWYFELGLHDSGPVDDDCLGSRCLRNEDKHRNKDEHDDDRDDDSAAAHGHKTSVVVDR